MTSLVAPLLAQVALTFALLVWLALARVGAARAGMVKMRDVALSGSAWPERVKQIGNCLSNQFEVPVLFYAAILLALVTRTSDGVLVGLAWGFVASRVLHAIIHTGSNNVLFRFYAFLLGVVLLAAIWALVGLRALGAGL